MMSKGAVGLQLLTSDVPRSSGTTEESRAPAAGGSFFKAGLNRDARIVLLHVDGLADESCMKQVEEELLRIRGVISFTFDLPRQRCTVRCLSTVEPVRLCRAVARTESMSAQQIVRKETGEEMLLAFVAVPESDEKDDMPDYLPEEFVEETSDKALRRTGDDDSSSGWLSSVSNFLAKTLYW